MLRYHSDQPDIIQPFDVHFLNSYFPSLLCIYSFAPFIKKYFLIMVKNKVAIQHVNTHAPIIFLCLVKLNRIRIVVDIDELLPALKLWCCQMCITELTGNIKGEDLSCLFPRGLGMVLQTLVPSVVSGMAEPVFSSAPCLCSSLAILLTVYKDKAKHDLDWYMLTLKYDQTFETLILL